MTTTTDAELLLAEMAIYGPRRGQQGYSAEQIEDARCALGQAMAYGRAWDWTRAERALDRAYAALRATNPAGGYAWHCGSHPLQVAIAAVRARDLDA